MKVLYYDCFSGISGDMNIGALLDLGVPFEYLRSELEKLGLVGEYELVAAKKLKMGIEGSKFDVKLVHRHHDFDHKHEHMHGHDHRQHNHDHHQHHHDHHHKHDDDHHHRHDHGHEHGHSHNEHDHHEHRGFSDIKSIIERSSLSNWVKSKAIEVFYNLATAEAKIHGKTVDEVHFHEVGAVDAIVDIVGAAICLEYLQVSEVYSLQPEVGSGFVKCAHGIMPVPAPATAELLVGVPFTQRVRGEATTPTGAALLKTLVRRFDRPENMLVERIGYGLGTKDFEQPNVLRVYLGRIESGISGLQQETQYLLETNIDDMNPELYGDIEARLYGAGALDVFRTPIFMKKGRLGIKLSVLYTAEHEQHILDIIFRESTAIGVRRTAVDKFMLERRFKQVDTSYGLITLKQAYYKGRLVNQKPEYEELASLARAHHMPIKELYNRIAASLEEHSE